MILELVACAAMWPGRLQTARGLDMLGCCVNISVPWVRSVLAMSKQRKSSKWCPLLMDWCCQCVKLAVNRSGNKGWIGLDMLGCRVNVLVPWVRSVLAMSKQMKSSKWCPPLMDWCCQCVKLAVIRSGNKGWIARYCCMRLISLFLWVGWLGLWHMNLYRLFNAKSIFMQITFPFQAIQFSISTQFKCKYTV